eukprot:COSAG01_NODE_62355_length_285_cov_0.650538_1_plen_73_part_10
MCGGTYLSAIRIEDMKSLLGAYDDTALEVMRWLEWMVARVMEFIPASTLSTLARAGWAAAVGRRKEVVCVGGV